MSTVRTVGRWLIGKDTKADSWLVRKRQGCGVWCLVVFVQDRFVKGRRLLGGVEDSSLVGKRKCCLVKAVVGQGDRQQQYYS